PTLYVPPGSARSENLACGDDNVAAQSIGVELKIDLGIECARKIALDHHAAESLFAPALDLGPELFAPFERDCIAGCTFRLAPGDGHAPCRHRKRAVLRGID